MRREFDLPVYNSSTPLRLTRLKELWRISVNGFTNDEVLSLVAYRWKSPGSIPMMTFWYRHNFPEFLGFGLCYRFFIN